MCDAFGLLSGHAIEQADAEQAYIQSPLGGAETYIRLPKELQPDSWKHMRDPVCKLVMSLYGHPDAGGFWQAHCKNALESVGFIEVSESWQSLFYHPELKVMMAVYVDDFKASGPVEALKKAWTLARSKIRTGAPTPIGRYLGCHHNVVELKDRRVIEYDTHDFLEQCVSHCKKVCGEDVVLKKASTPFLDEDKLPEEDDNEPGKLADAACSVLMKVLYGARLARFDLLKAVAGLASKVTKWSVSCDKRLFRLMCYINDSKGLKMRGYVGRDDKAEDLFLRLFADADFAGCRDTARSTSGLFLGIYGKNTFVPVAAQAKKQSCVSHSTPEAELVAANLALRTQGLPALEVFDKVFGRKVKLFFEEDNNTAISTIKAGYSNTMRHLGRTHRVSLRWMHEVFQDGQCEIRRCDTLLQAADIFTKGFTCRDKWVVVYSAELRPRVPDLEELRASGQPVAIIGGGLGGIASARELQRRGLRFQLFERSGGLGGSWAQLANQSSKVQIERGTYHLGMASGTACPQDMPNYAKRDEVLAHLQAFVQEHGLAEHCQFSAEVCEVRTDNNNINNNNNNSNSYSISWKPPGGADVTPVWATGFGALMVLPGFLPRPRGVLLPQESVFQGTVAYGVSDDVPSSALVAPKRVAILGHGAFAVEHARTAAEAGAAGVAIICRRRNLVLPRVVSWLVDGAGDGADVDVETMLSLVKPMYQLLGFSSVAEALPRSLMKNDRGRWVLTQSNPAISDVYFLLQAQGMLEVVVGAVEAVQPHSLLVQPLEGPEVSTKLHLREIPCDTLIKCLGWDHSAQADLGRALGMQSIHGFWLDGDPRRFLFKFSSSATNGASNMNTLSFFVLLKHAHVAFFHFLARPSALAAALHGLPVVSSLGEDFGATFVGQAFMAMARAVPELREAGREINRLKAERIRETHPVEDFVRDLAAEWAEYQQARLAPGVPAQVYPYSEATAAQFLAERQATAEAAAQGPGVANSQAEDGLERWLFLSAPRGLAKALRREGGTRVPAGGFLCLPGSPSYDSGWTTDEADAEEEELAQKQCLASWPFAERAEGVASDAEAAASASVAASAVVLLPPLGRGGLDEHRAALQELSAELTRQSAARTRSRSSRERVVVVVTTFGGRLPESAGPLWAFWEELLGSNGRIAAGDEGSRLVLLDLATASGEVPTSTSTLALLLSQNLGRLLDDTMPRAAVRGDQLFAIQQTLQLRYLPGGVQSGSAPNSAAAPSLEALRDRVLAAAQSALGSGDNEEDQLLADTSLLDAGLDSLAQIDVRQALGRQLGPQASRLLTASVLFDHPTAESLARRLFEELFVSRQEAPAASLEPAAPQVLSLEPGRAMPVAEQQQRSDQQAQPGQEEAKEQVHCRTEVLVGSRRCGLLVPEAWQQQRPSRLLFLHGARADAEITARIMRATGWTRPQSNPVFEVALAEAPHEDKADPSLFEGAVRLGWYDPAGRYRQWLLPREELGAASQAEEDQRWSESVEVISEVWRSWGPFDGIAGLCEGAAAAALAALTPGSLQPPPRFLLSVGGFASDRPQYQAAYSSPAGFPSLHIVGSEEGSSAQALPELEADLEEEEVAGELPAGELAVWLCEYPGHGVLSEEAPLRSLRALVRAIYDELLALAALGAFGQLPLALFGHSMGSAVMVQLTELLSPSSFGLEAGSAGQRAWSFMSALEGLSLAFGTAYRERASDFWSNSPAVRDTADLLCADFAACFEAVLYGDRDPGCTMPAQSCQGVLVLPAAEVASMLVAELRAALPMLLAEPAVAEDNAPARAEPSGAAENAPDQAPLQQQAGFPTAAAAGGSTTAATTAATTDESGGKKQLLWLQKEVVRAIIRASPRTREQFKGLLEALGSSSSSSAESCNAQAGDEQVTEEEDEDKPSSRPKLLDTSFAELGFGSLEWMLIRESLSTSLGGVRVPPQLVFQGPTITSLSYLLLPLQAQPAGQPPQLLSQLQQPQTQTQLQPPTQPQQQQQPQPQQQQQQQQQNPLLEVNIPRGLAASQIGSNVRLGLNLRLEGPVVICDGAVVRDNVTLGGGCELGEFCMVGPQVELGPNCRVAPMGMVQNDVVLGFGCQVAERALLRGPLRAGNRCNFDEQSIIGGHSSHLNAVRHGQIQIGNNCTFEIGSVVLAPRGVHGAPGVTRIGDGVIVHMKAEVSHDCVLEDGVACNGELSGFCHIMKGGKVSKGTVLHQFTTVGTGAFLAMSRKVRLDVLPYCIFDEHSVLDRVSLGRNGVSPEEADELDAFYQRHFSSEAAQYCQSVEGLLPRSSDGEGFWFASELRRFFAIRAQMRDQRLLATFGVDESVHQLRRPSS
ncbi:unnamed protein product, partial [Polarella glacialis]